MTTPGPNTPMPRFGDLQGSYYYSLPLKPPFSISNLTTRLFPLRASLDALQGFCNNYLNLMPRELGRFRACSPYVMLMMMDYGSLALEVTNLGWFSQREIMFCVPVEWYRVLDGKWVFQDWAMIPAFIYVDDELSLPMGRTVAGWPKVFVRMTPTLSATMHDPLAPVVEDTVSTLVFPELFTGRRQEERVFLEVEREATMANLRMPPDARSPIAPWSLWYRMAASSAGLARDAVSWMAGLGMLPTQPSTSPENYMAMLARMAGMANPMRPDLVANVINLKQFRASESPAQYCYQAYTLGSMRFTAFNGLGMLGEQAVLSGDVSGGYSIKLHEWPSLPIVRTLGLDVARRWQGDGATVALLKPVLPFWYDCNMDYQTGYNLAWRTRDGIWHDRDGRAMPRVGRRTPDALLYNTALGASTRPVAGPFRFSGTTIRVLPLLAERRKLETFLDEYLNDPLQPAGERFRLWAPDPGESPYAYVYMTATSFGDVTSGTDNVGDWADRELALLVPVRRERRTPRGWELTGVGVVPAFTYVNNGTAAIAGSEVLGIPTTPATFIETESSWMSEEGPAVDSSQTLLIVNTEVLPAVGAGERSARRRIIDVSSGLAPDTTGGTFWRLSGDRWSGVLRGELQRKKAAKAAHSDDVRRARALALEVLGNGVPLAFYTMKQYRDNADPDQACYQSIVRVQRTLTEVLDFREIEEPLVVRMIDFPTQAIVKLLGLVGKPIRDEGIGVAYALQPIRPFWLRVTMEEQLGERLLYRASTTEWTRDAREEARFLAGAPPIVVGADVSRIQDQGDPRRMAKTAQDWHAFRRDESGARDISLDEARTTLDAIDPQLVLETILSREWGNWNDAARWRLGRRELVSEYVETLVRHRRRTRRRGGTGLLPRCAATPGQAPWCTSRGLARRLHPHGRAAGAVQQGTGRPRERVVHRRHRRHAEAASAPDVPGDRRPVVAGRPAEDLHVVPRPGRRDQPAGGPRRARGARPPGGLRRPRQRCAPRGTGAGGGAPDPRAPRLQGGRRGGRGRGAPRAGVVAERRGPRARTLRTPARGVVQPAVQGVAEAGLLRAARLRRPRTRPALPPRGVLGRGVVRRAGVRRRRGRRAAEDTPVGAQCPAVSAGPARHACGAARCHAMASRSVSASGRTTTPSRRCSADGGMGNASAMRGTACHASGGLIPASNVAPSTHAAAMPATRGWRAAGGRTPASVAMRPASASRATSWPESGMGTP